MILEQGLLHGQVLQRRRNQTASATLRGKCSNSGALTVTIRHKGKPLKGWANRTIGSARNGRFAAKLNGVAVGGPYEIKLSIGGESTIVHRVWVGDVWLLAGQSNMQGCGNLDTAPKPHPLVHAMYMDDHWDVAREPIHFLADSPDMVHCFPRPSPAERRRLRRTNLKGVGPGIFFGKEMVRRSGGVPQGLLCTAHGGTSMEQWDPAKKKHGGKSLYGSMLRTWRKTGQPVAGMLWYQGESDALAERAPFYTQRMKRFVAAVRRDLKQPELPFIMAQIGKVFGNVWNPRWWNSIQDQQSKLHRQIKNLACVATVDLPLDDSIHIGTEGHARLGVRLARLADRMVYGNRRELPAPELVEISTKQDKKIKAMGAHRLTLTFKNVVGGLRSQGEPTGFDLVDSSHSAAHAFYKTLVRRNQVILETMQPNNGTYALMYGHGCARHVNICDGRGMPIPVFGPARIEKRVAYTPFITTWLVSPVLPDGKPVHKLAPPRQSRFQQLQKKTYETLFVNEHLSWAGKSGQCVFFSEVKLAEPMRLNLRLGYDGPIKVWIDNKPIFADANGTNPAAPDQAIRPLSLQRGRHKLAVAMDLNRGRAWGFFLRFDRRGISSKRIAQGNYAVPECSL